MGLYSDLRDKINYVIVPTIVQLLNELELNEVHVNTSGLIFSSPDFHSGNQEQNKHFVVRENELDLFYNTLLIFKKDGNVFIGKMVNNQNRLPMFQTMTGYRPDSILQNREFDNFLIKIKNFEKLNINQWYFENFANSLLSAVE